jgi:hypothetical protein
MKDDPTMTFQPFMSIFNITNWQVLNKFVKAIVIYKLTSHYPNLCLRLNKILLVITDMLSKVRWRKATLSTIRSKSISLPSLFSPNQTQWILSCRKNLVWHDPCPEEALEAFCSAD